jgi:glycosyltransferase involved in cell wall biosynthesis
LKIVSIGPASPLRGGIAKFNESFVLTCISEGYDTEVFSYKFLYPAFLFPGTTQYSGDPAPDDLQIHSVIHSLNPINWLKTASVVSSLEPDLVVIHYWMPFFAPAMGVICRRIKRKNHPVIITIAHNLIPHEKQPGTNLFTRFFLKSVDGFVSLSSSVLNDFRSFRIPRKSLFLPHPIYDIYGNKPSRDEALNYLQLDPGNKYLLFFGLIRKYKGLDLLLDAFSGMSDEKLKLIVAGEFYEDSRHYLKKAMDHDILDRVIFIGKFIPDNEVRYYFAAAETVVQPYITATQSGVTQIAYHFDCPMVVTNVGGLPEIVLDGKTGYVCEKEPASLAAAIQRSLDPQNHALLVDGIIKEKHRFSWNVFVRKIIEMATEIRNNRLQDN